MWVRAWQGQRLKGLEEWNLPFLPRAPIHLLTSELVIGSVQVSGIGQTLLATLAPHGPRRPPPVPPGLWEGAPGGWDRALTRRPLAAKGLGARRVWVRIESGDREGSRAHPGVLGQERKGGLGSR